MRVATSSMEYDSLHTMKRDGLTRSLCSMVDTRGCTVPSIHKGGLRRRYPVLVGHIS